MQRAIVRQVCFLVFMTAILILLMGLVIVTNAKAQAVNTHHLFGPSTETGYSSVSDREWDDDWDFDGEEKRGSFVTRYNRVEGLYTGVELKKDPWRQKPNPVLYGLCGYAFSAKEFQYQLGIDKGFFNEFRLGFGGEYHRVIDTPDRWIIPDVENTLAAFFLKEDFQDFFFKEGGSGTITQNFTQAWTLSAAYQSDRVGPLKRNKDVWSLFGGKKRFRDNPLMSKGNIRSLVGRLVLDTRDSEDNPVRGWYIQIEAERAGNGLQGDYRFDRWVADIRRYQTLGYGSGFDLRIKVGTSNGLLPWQRTFHLGGLSTLRGFSYKAYPDGPMSPGGNRMVLAQLEYKLGQQDLTEAIDLGILEHFQIILFTDAGWVEDVGENAKYYEGFDGFTVSNLKNDVGLALTNRSGNVRLEVARRTDIGKKPFVVLFRINRPY